VSPDNYVWRNKQVLSTADAQQVVTASLRAQGASVVRFHTGIVKASVNEKPEDPHYRLMERAGLLNQKKGTVARFPSLLQIKAKSC